MNESFQPSTVAVCIPVRNEATLLPRLLGALAGQVVPAELKVVWCFLLDHCHDRSAAIINGFARRESRDIRVETVPESGATANAGRARRRALAMGEAAVDGSAAGILLTTDADSDPAPDWIVACCRGLMTSDVVVGRIVRGGGLAIPAQDRLEAYYDRLHRIRRRCDPVAWDCPQGHHSVGGANMAFRADAYRMLGGFAEMISGEDSAIVDTAHRMGLRVRHDREAVVTTSSRRHGRATAGLADHLREIEHAMTLPMVTHPDEAVWQYRGHAAARASHARLHESTEVSALAVQLKVDEAHIQRVAASTGNAHAFATHVVPAAPGGGRSLLLDAAEAALDILERAGYERAA